MMIWLILTVIALVGIAGHYIARASEWDFPGNPDPEEIPPIRADAVCARQAEEGFELPVSRSPAGKNTGVMR